MSRNEPGGEADDSVPFFGDGARVGKILAQQHVRVRGIEVKRPAGADELMDRAAVSGGRRTNGYGNEQQCLQSDFRKARLAGIPDQAVKERWICLCRGAAEDRRFAGEAHFRKPAGAAGPKDEAANLFVFLF